MSLGQGKGGAAVKEESQPRDQLRTVPELNFSSMAMHFSEIEGILKSYSEMGFISTGAAATELPCRQARLLTCCELTPLLTLLAKHSNLAW